MFFSKVLLSTQVTALFAASGNLLAMAPKAAIPKSDGNDAFPAHEARHDSSSEGESDIEHYEFAGNTIAVQGQPSINALVLGMMMSQQMNMGMGKGSQSATQDTKGEGKGYQSATEDTLKGKGKGCELSSEDVADPSNSVSSKAAPKASSQKKGKGNRFRKSKN